MKVEGFKDTIAWYDDEENARKYADSAEKVPPFELLTKFAAMLQPGAAVLDAGCGSGRDTRAMQKMGLRATGLDISKGLLEEARKRSEEIDFVEGDLTHMQFANGSFDGVWSHASLVHLEKREDVQKTLSEFNRVLKPNGVLHIFVKMQQGEEKTAVVTDKLSNHDRFFRYYTDDELRSFVSAAGFGDIETSTFVDPHGRDEVTWIALFARKQ